MLSLGKTILAVAVVLHATNAAQTSSPVSRTITVSLTSETDDAKEVCRLLANMLPPMSSLPPLQEEKGAELGGLVRKIVGDLQSGAVIDEDRYEALRPLVGESATNEKNDRQRLVYTFEVLKKSLDSHLSLSQLDEASLMMTDDMASQFSILYPKSIVLPRQRATLDKPDFAPRLIVIARPEFETTPLKRVIPFNGNRYRLKAAIMQPLEKPAKHKTSSSSIYGSGVFVDFRSLSPLDTAAMISDPVKQYPLLTVYQMDSKLSSVTTRKRKPIKYLSNLGDNKSLLLAPLSVLASAFDNLPGNDDSPLVTVLRKMRERHDIDDGLFTKIGQAVKDAEAASSDLAGLASGTTLVSLIKLLPPAFVTDQISSFSMQSEAECRVCESVVEEPKKDTVIYDLPNFDRRKTTLGKALQDILVCVNEESIEKVCKECHASTSHFQIELYSCVLKRYLFLSSNFFMDFPLNDLSFCNQKYDKLVAIIKSDEEDQMTAFVRLEDSQDWIKIGQDDTIEMVTAGEATRATDEDKVLIYRKD